MTFPPDDQGEQRPGGSWSQPPQYPPPYRRADYPHHRPDQPGYDEPGYRQSGGPGYDDPGHDDRGYDDRGYDDRGYDEPDYPPPRRPGGPQDGYPETGQSGYPYAEEPGYPPGGETDYRDPHGTSRTTRTPGAPPGTRRGRGQTSTSAFTSLVLGILGLLASFLAPILAIVFGIAGLRRSRRPGRRAGAMAITGIMLGVMWIVLTAVFAVLILRNEGYGSIAALPAGSCFNNAQPGHIAVRVHYLSSCSEPHNGEVVGTFALPGTAWPGQQAVSREAATGCAQLLTSVLGQQSLSSGVRGMNYSPDQQAWSTGTRAVSCVLLDPNAEHTGSMLAGG
jgi:hypothetical protein